LSEDERLPLLGTLFFVSVFFGIIVISFIALSRGLGFYHLWLEIMFNLIPISSHLTLSDLFNVGLPIPFLKLDFFFLLSLVSLFVYTRLLFDYKEKKRKAGQGEFRYHAAYMIGLIFFALFVFLTMIPMANPLVVVNRTEAPAIIPLITWIYEIRGLPDFVIVTTTWEFFLLIGVNFVILMSVGFQVFWHEYIELTIKKLRREGKPGYHILKLFIEGRLRSPYLRFIFAGFIASTLYYFIVVPREFVRTQQLFEVIDFNIFIYQNSFLNLASIWALTLFIWLFSIGYYLTVSDFAIMKVATYLWETRRPDIVILLILLVMFIALAPFALGLFIGFLGICIGASVLFHRRVISSFEHFETLSEEYLDCYMQKLLSKSKGHILIIGVGPITREILSDIIPIKRNLPDERIAIWADGPYMFKLIRGRIRSSYVLHNVIVLADSPEKIRTLGQFPTVGTYGFISIPLEPNRPDFYADVLVPAVVSKIGTTVTPTLKRSAFVTITEDSPHILQTLLEEIKNIEAIPKPVQKPAVLANITASSQLYHNIQFARSKKIDMIHVYFEREIGHHLGAVLASAKVGRSRSGSYDYLIFGEGQKRIYHCLETLFFHGKLKVRKSTRSRSRWLKALIVTDDNELISLCKKDKVTGKLAFQVFWMDKNGFKDYLLEVKKQQVNYTILHSLLKKHPIKGILVAENTQQQNIVVVSQLIQAIQQLERTAPLIVVCAHGELDQRTTNENMIEQNIPFYSVIGSRLISHKISSILRTLRAPRIPLSKKDLPIKQLEQITNRPMLKVPHRLHCPVTAFAEWFPKESGKSSGIEEQEITPFSRVVYACVPDSVGKLAEVTGKFTNQSYTPSKSIIDKPTTRKYSIVAFCGEEKPGIFSNVLQRILLNVKNLQPFDSNNKRDLNISHVSTFDCGLGNRTCISLFVHKFQKSPVFTDQNKQGEVYLPRMISVLAPTSKDAVIWNTILNSRLSRKHQIRSKKLNSNQHLIFASLNPISNADSFQKLINSCKRSDCIFNRYQTTIGKMLQVPGKKPVVKREFKKMLGSIHYVTTGVCSSPGSPDSYNCLGFVNFQKPTKK